MTRTRLAIATALLAAPTLFVPTAKSACIACEYVPEVVRGSRTSDPPPYYARERSYTVEREYGVPARRHVVRIEPIIREREKKIERAEVAPDKQQVDNENSSISSATVEHAKVETTASQSENSSIAMASTTIATAKKEPVAEPAIAGKPVDCRKYFPSVGLTLRVPCETQ